MAAVFFSAQYYPETSYSGGNGWYSTGDSFYFGDDYYYEYPEDYYPEEYYQSYYNDYRQSISMVNWQRFARDYRLSPMQLEMIMDLNRQFDSYYTWNSYYRVNPDRWYYDRFYALEQILGPRIFIVFQNFYGGYSPVAYYSRRGVDYYRPRYHVRPRYTNVNINIYRVNPQYYHQNHGSNYGWNQPRRNQSLGGFREDGGKSTGVRNSSFGSSIRRPAETVTGRRSTETGILRGNNGQVYSGSRENSGYRNNGAVRTGGMRSESSSVRSGSNGSASSSNTSGGFRTGNSATGRR